MTSHLYPFTKPDNTYYLPTDVINIESQLGYTYGPGSLDEIPLIPLLPTKRRIQVDGVDRGTIRGSFVILAVFYTHTPAGARKRVVFGRKSILSRWNIEGCINCQAHLGVSAVFPVPDNIPADAEIQVEIHTHFGVLLATAGDVHAETRHTTVSFLE